MPEKELPVAHTVIEYAIVYPAVYPGKTQSTVLYGPTTHSEWSETISLQQAAERWYPGGVVVTRTHTRYEDTFTEWVPRLRDGMTSGDER